MRGDPCSADELRAALPGHDAVLSALGPSGIGRNTLVERRRAEHCERHAGDRRAPVCWWWAWRCSSRYLLLNEVRPPDVPPGTSPGTTRRWKASWTASNLDWTIARPPRLTNGPLHPLLRRRQRPHPHGDRADDWPRRPGALPGARHPAHIQRIVGLASLRAAARD